ncbi:MAG: DUF4846 domain-containing protein [Vicingaceae bacterium]|nr:DUF4846 domain-containing protein [Vicingaceae bacterium]
MATKNSYLFYVALCCFVTASCQNNTTKNDTLVVDSTLIDSAENYISVPDTLSYNYAWLNEYNYKEALCNNIPVPLGFKRTKITQNSFSDWLRHLPLNLTDNTVYLHSGEEKYNQSAQFAVINIDVGNKDLQQCADAVMRLRAEYLFATSKTNQIKFNYTNGATISLKKWSEGFYPKLQGNKVVWVTSSKNNTTYNSFRKYMDNIFMYAGTSSLSKELIEVNLSDMKIGDVFIKGGFPGHAVIVIDMAENPSTKEKVFMLAQSYMPAQNIHVLKNPNNSSLSPWYSVADCETEISTPEWTFTPDQLMKFND